MKYRNRRLISYPRIPFSSEKLVCNTAMEFQVRSEKKITGRFPQFGAIFMSNASTMEECWERRLFGLPMASADFVKEVKVGMILFLFEYEKRELYGVYKATSDGELNISPHAYKSSGKKFPAQVTFTTVWHCHPLQENEFEEVIRSNYFAKRRFNFGLSKDQVQGLLSLFDSRKIRLFHSQSSMDGEFRKRHCDFSPENDGCNHSKNVKKKLKREIDIVPYSNEESLAYSVELTVAEDRFQLFESGDAHIASFVGKESDSVDLNSSNFPEGPSCQNSLPFATSHSSPSGQETGPCSDHAIQHVSIGEEVKEFGTSGNLDIDLGEYIPLLPSDDSDHTIQLQQVNVGEEVKELEPSGNFDTDLGDFIPLSDDFDSCDTNASPESAFFMKYQIALPFFASGVYQGNATSSKSTDNHQENKNSDCINHCTPVRGLYSDASNSRGSVFSRLRFSSRVQDKEDDSTVDCSYSTEEDKSAQEIMEELQQMHYKWKKTARMTARCVEGKHEDAVTKKSNVFLRLS